MKSNKLEELKNKIENLIYYISDLIDTNSYDNITLLEEVILTEISDLRIGVDLGRLKMPTKNIELVSMSYVKSGSITDDKLKELIIDVQEELYKLRNEIKYPNKLMEKIYPLMGCLSIFIAVGLFIFAAFKQKIIYWVFPIVFFIAFIICIVLTIKTTQSNLKFNKMFPNLPYEKCSYVFTMTKKDQDMLHIEYKNGFAIEVGFLEEINQYAIDVIKDQNWENIYQTFTVKKRFEIVYVLKELMLEIEVL